MHVVGELDGQMRWFWAAPYLAEAAALATKFGARCAARTPCPVPCPASPMPALTLMPPLAHGSPRSRLPSPGLAWPGLASPRLACHGRTPSLLPLYSPLSSLPAPARPAVRATHKTHTEPTAPLLRHPAPCCSPSLPLQQACGHTQAGGGGAGGQPRRHQQRRRAGGARGHRRAGHCAVRRGHTGAGVAGGVGCEGARVHQFHYCARAHASVTSTEIDIA